MTSVRYTRTAITLHWLVALAILGSFSLGLTMQGLPLSPLKLELYSWHKWAGVTIFTLVAMRLVWRLAHQPPPLPTTMPAWQQHAARATHALLYVLMFAIPLSGWLMSSAKGFQTVYFGVLPIPDLLAKDAALGDLLRAVHQTLNFTMITIVLGHAVVAIKHHLHDRDDVLVRMLPLLRKPVVAGAVPTAAK